MPPALGTVGAVGRARATQSAVTPAMAVVLPEAISGGMITGGGLCTGAHMDDAHFGSTDWNDRWTFASGRLDTVTSDSRRRFEPLQGKAVRVKIAEDPDRYVFAKLYSRTHLRSDRSYKLWRTLVYGRLEDEERYTSVRRLVEYDEIALGEILLRSSPAQRRKANV